jgi:hypothetical protein
METLAFNGDFNSLASFVVHAIFGLVAGGLCALLYWQRPSRQPAWFPASLPARPGVTLAAGLFVVPTLLFALWAYCSYLTPFFSAHVSSAAVTFAYRFPDREVTVPRNAIQRVVKSLSNAEGQWVALVVYTKDGRRFESAPIKPERFEILKGRLQPVS